MTESSTRQSTERTLAQVADVSRVALPTAGFWLAKGLSTAVGEAVSDWSVNALVPELAVFMGFVGFSAALVFQLRRRRYTPWAYWTAVAMVGIFGTMAADVAHVVLHAPYAVSFVGYGGLLAGLFILWRAREGTVDVHEVTTASREYFYWGAVVLTFAMGTALGDLTAVTCTWATWPLQWSSRSSSPCRRSGTVSWPGMRWPASGAPTR